MSTFYSFPAKSSKLTRRQFVQRSTLAATLAAMYAPALLRGQNLNSKLNIACVGVGGKGATDSGNCAELGENIYAICDVDKGTLQSAAARKVKDQEVFTNAARYTDYRKM